jgi:hypothetical protein
MQRKRNNPVISLRMQEALQRGPHSYDQLAEISGLGKSAVQTWVKTLRAQEPAPIFIESFGPDKNGRPFVPLWRWRAAADQVDAERPGDSLTDAERMRRFRAEKKASK